MIVREERIGGCRLIQGDCIKVMSTLRAESVNMIWTDPPYGHNNHDGDFNSRLNEKRGIVDKPIANDGADDMRRIVDGMLAQAVRLMPQDCCCCCCCCCGGGGPRPTFAWLAERMDTAGLTFFHSVIWDKNNPGLGWRYRRQHEMVMVAHRDGGKLQWADGAAACGNILQVSPPRERKHPNEKPIRLVDGFIQRHTAREDVVLDPFMGSGTTLVACAKLGRKGIGIEIDPDYFDIAVERVKKAYEQPDLFVAPLEPPEQKKLDV